MEVTETLLLSDLERYPNTFGNIVYFSAMLFCSENPVSLLPIHICGSMVVNYVMQRIDHDCQKHLTV